MIDKMKPTLGAMPWGYAYVLVMLCDYRTLQATQVTVLRVGLVCQAVVLCFLKSGSMTEQTSEQGKLSWIKGTLCNDTGINFPRRHNNL